MSHKYIYKKKINGKWRYFYDVGKSGIKGQSNIKQYSRFQDVMGYDERDTLERSQNNLNRALNQEQEYFKRANDSGWTDKKMSNRYERSGKSSKIALEKYDRDREAFGKTPLGKIEGMKDNIKRGKMALASLLEKSAKKLRQ